VQKKQKLSHKDAKAQRLRKERLCVFFASLRLCVSSSFWLRFIRVVPLEVKSMLFERGNPKLKIQSHFWILCFEFWGSGR
jgi:hypothetical protein